MRILLKRVDLMDICGGNRQHNFHQYIFDFIDIFMSLTAITKNKFLHLITFVNIDNSKVLKEVGGKVEGGR